LALHQVPKELPNSLVLLHEFPECLFNSTQNPTISEDYGRGVVVDVGYTSLLEGNAPTTCERLAMKEKIIKKIIIISITKILTLRGTPGNPA